MELASPHDHPSREIRKTRTSQSLPITWIRTERLFTRVLLHSWKLHCNCLYWKKKYLKERKQRTNYSRVLKEHKTTKTKMASLFLMCKIRTNDFLSSTTTKASNDCTELGRPVCTPRCPCQSLLRNQPWMPQSDMGSHQWWKGLSAKEWV